MSKINDIFETDIKFELDESASEVDGEHILAKLKGSYFVPNGVSRNKRFYGKDVWETQLQKKHIQKKLSERRMFGTISHEQPLNDTALLEGKVSHVMTKLEIREGKGYGEALVLNTPAGRILNTLARAKVKMFASSRANGTYQGKHEGMPKVSAQTYALDGFDFVIDPGFLEASPELDESISQAVDEVKTLTNGAFSAPKETLSEDEKAMDKELFESLVKENGSIKSDLQLALKEGEDLKESNINLEEENKILQEKVESLSSSSEAVKVFEKLGTVEEIEEKFKKLEEAEAKLKAFEELGSHEDIDAALDLSKEKLEAYAELGTPEKVEEALETAKALILEYQELGSPDKIKKVFEHTQSMIEESKAEKAKGAVKKLAEELNVSVELVEKVYGKMDEDEIKEFFKNFGESKDLSNKYKKPIKESKEENKQERVLSKSTGQRIFERLGR